MRYRDSITRRLLRSPSVTAVCGVLNRILGRPSGNPRARNIYGTVGRNEAGICLSGVLPRRSRITPHFLAVVIQVVGWGFTDLSAIRNSGPHTHMVEEAPMGEIFYTGAWPGRGMGGRRVDGGRDLISVRKRNIP